MGRTSKSDLFNDKYNSNSNMQTSILFLTTSYTTCALNGGKGQFCISVAISISAFLLIVVVTVDG